MKRAEKRKNEEIKNILKKLQDTQKELEATKADKENIIQQREEEELRNIAVRNMVFQLAYEISDMRAEKVSFFLY